MLTCTYQFSSLLAQCSTSLVQAVTSQTESREPLSLYSTATQNCLRRAILRYLTQKIVLLCYLMQKNTNMLVSLALGDANFLRWPCTFLFFVKISFALGRQREPHFQWNIGDVGSPTQHFHVGHVHFMLFMSISFPSGTQRKLVFQWNMGFKECFDCDHVLISV